MAKISVIIPVFREEASINGTIGALRRLPGGEGVEIVVVDGEANGATAAVIRDPAVRTILSPKGRGVQMNRGAREATGDALLFLHADTTLPPCAVERIEAAVADETVAGGAFELAIDSPRPAFRLIERVANLRSRLTRVPYGDQAIFLKARLFRELGGYREIPIMEEVELLGRVRRAGRKIVIFPEPVLTSARRWETEGILRCTLRNWLLMGLYLCGAKPERLARFYR